MWGCMSASECVKLKWSSPGGVCRIGAMARAAFKVLNVNLKMHFLTDFNQLIQT